MVIYLKKTSTSVEYCERMLGRWKEFFLYFFFHTVVEKQRRCKFDVELPYNLCQHFEQFLVVNRLTYSKFDCNGHETDPTTSSSPSPNPFLLPESDSSSANRDNGDSVKFSKEDTSAELLEWFSLNNQRLCMEHFARLIISENQDYLEHLLSLETEDLSAEHYKDMVRIELFLKNRELQGVLSCKCGSPDDLSKLSLVYFTLLP